MKKKLSILTLTLCISTSSTILAESVDIDKHWAKNDIKYLERENIMFSVNNKFRPNDYITRAEFMNAINNNFGYTNKLSKVDFTDVYKDSWYYEDIMKAVSAGYINGYDDGSIKPNETLTREEAAKIIAIACNLDKVIPKSIHNFKDINDMSNWSILYINILYEKGYMGGYDDGRFRPRNYITRGETASILANIRRKTLGDLVASDYDDSFKSYGYSVQVGSFSNFKTARDLKNSLVNFGFDDSFIVQFPNSTSYSVLVSSLLSLSDAKNLKFQLDRYNIDSYITDKSFSESNIIKEYVDHRPTNPRPVNPPKEIPVNLQTARNLSVQAGTFSTIDAAVKLRNQLIKSGFRDSYILKFRNNTSYFVMVKSNLNKNEAQNLKAQLERQKFEAFVTSKKLSDGIKI